MKTQQSETKEFINFPEFGGYCTSPNLFVKKTGKPDPFGILSENIFGPLSSYRCACGFLKHKTLDLGKTCPRCGVLCDDNILRLKTFGKIKLVTPIFKLTKKNDVIKIIGKFHKQLLDSRQTDANSALSRYICVKNNRSEIHITTDINNIPQDYFLIPFRIGGIFSLIFVLDYIATTYNIESIQNLFIENAIIDEIDVLPPDARPVFKDPKNPEVLRYENINKFYISLLNSNNRNKLFFPTIKDEIKIWTEQLDEKRLTNDTQEIQNSNIIEYDQIASFYQNFADEIYKWCFNHIRGKQGLIRSTSLSRTLEFTGRTVVTVDPDVRPYCLKVPREMLYTLWMPYFVHYLTVEKEIMQFDDAFHNVTSKKYNEFRMDKKLFNHFLEFLKWFTTSDEAKTIEY